MDFHDLSLSQVLLNLQFNPMQTVNKKKGIAESIEIYRVRICQLNEDLKGQNLSNEQRGTLESEKRIANEEMMKLETTKQIQEYS